MHVRKSLHMGKFFFFFAHVQIFRKKEKKKSFFRKFFSAPRAHFERFRGPWGRFFEKSFGLGDMGLIQKVLEFSGSRAIVGSQKIPTIYIYIYISIVFR